MNAISSTHWLKGKKVPRSLKHAYLSQECRSKDVPCESGAHRAPANGLPIPDESVNSSLERVPALMLGRALMLCPALMLAQH